MLEQQLNPPRLYHVSTESKRIPKNIPVFLVLAVGVDHNSVGQFDSLANVSESSKFGLPLVMKTVLLKAPKERLLNHSEFLVKNVASLQIRCTEKSWKNWEMERSVSHRTARFGSVFN